MKRYKISWEWSKQNGEGVMLAISESKKGIWVKWDDICSICKNLPYENVDKYYKDEEP